MVADVDEERRTALQPHAHAEGGEWHRAALRSGGSLHLRLHEPVVPRVRRGHLVQYLHSAFAWPAMSVAFVAIFGAADGICMATRPNSGRLALGQCQVEVTKSERINGPGRFLVLVI